ncbi:MAG: M20/M25/M40 family metallo-hydrolase [Candidatus Aminicenantes bacterium]|nr:M20/M25/M40 family metallo-hydrolase [Candidatus Aminicenantes bacterium]
MRRQNAGALFVALAVCLAPACARRSGAPDAAARYRDVVDRLRAAGLAGERAHRFLERICSVGPRLTGSAEADAAVALSLELMSGAGLENVHSEPVEVGRWVRGRAAEAAVAPTAARPALPLAVAALGGSVGTPDGGLTAPVVEVRSLDEAAALGPKAAGRIVFYNRPMDRRLAEPFAAYGGAADQRVAGASAAARSGAVAVLVRSLTFREDRHPHTGMLRYEPGAPEIPAAAVAAADADRLGALLREEPEARVTLILDGRNEGRVVSANAVGEIAGSERPDEIVLLGGHLDSWDLSVGAHDDAAGCAAALEALALLRDLGLRPKRTVRAVFFMDEEFGGTGGRAYAASPLRQGERHIVAAESDRGGFVPVGLAVGRPGSAALERMTALRDLLRPFGVAAVGPGGGGVDVAPLVAKGAEPAAVLPNAQPYFDVHHSALDTVAAVHPRELELQAIVLAVLAYVLAQEGVGAP